MLNTSVIQHNNWLSSSEEKRARFQKSDLSVIQPARNIKNNQN